MAGKQPLKKKEVKSFNINDFKKNLNLPASAEKPMEWFIMPKEVYFEVCEKGFKYFYENRVDRPFL